jgi:hypothetical protein
MIDNIDITRAQYNRAEHFAAADASSKYEFSTPLDIDADGNPFWGFVITERQTGRIVYTHNSPLYNADEVTALVSAWRVQLMLECTDTNMWGK